MVARGLRDPLDDDVDRRIEEREDAVLLVAEVLVERRLDIPASRAIASAVASAKPLRAKTAEAAANRRARWRSWRTSSGGACRPRGAVSGSLIALDGRWRDYPLAPHAPVAPPSPPPARRRDRRLRAVESSAGDFKGAEKDVAETIEQLQTSAQNRKPEDICSEVLSSSLVDKLKSSGNDCVDEMEKIIGDADDRELEVTKVTITATNATATVKARRGDHETPSRTSRSSARTRSGG